MTESARPHLLVISGHDPSGGAGIDADRAAVRSIDVSVSEVITAFTDQDDRGVRAIGARDPLVWLEEADRVREQRIDAIKFGLLPGEAHVRAAAELVRRARARESLRTARSHGSWHESSHTARSHESSHTARSRGSMRTARIIAQGDLAVVVDPVLRSSSGTDFLDARGIEVLRGELACESVILTPNLHEAAALACMPEALLTSSRPARIDAARILLALGARAVVIKGGHGAEDPVGDLVAEADRDFVWLEHPRVQGGGIRGSGCRFAAHLSARLALGETLEESARAAGRFVASEIARAHAAAR